MTYKLYTDAGARLVDENYWVSLTGVVLDDNDYPVCEFIKLEVQKHPKEIEMAALLIGLDVIKDFVIHNQINQWDIYSDSKGSIKKMQGDSRKTPKEPLLRIAKLKELGCKMTYTHIERKMNTYANALANYRYNCYMFGDKGKCLHGLNRAKRVFFARLKAGEAINLEFRTRFISVSSQIREVTEQIEILTQLEHHPVRQKRMDKMQKLLNKLMTFENYTSIDDSMIV